MLLFCFSLKHFKYSTCRISEKLSQQNVYELSLSPERNMLLFSLGLKHRENAVLGETYLIFITATKHT